MEILAAFLLLVGVNGAKIATDKFNSSPHKVKRETMQMDREQMKSFNRFLKNGERLSREGE